MTTAPLVPLLVLDIDGTVREGKDDPLGRFVNTAADVRVFPAAVAQMCAWKQKGGRIVGVSNQGGIALGILTEQDVAAAMYETRRQAGADLFDAILWCRHHPDATDPMQARCWCRKPSPGLIVAAALDLSRRHGEQYPSALGLMVGDRPEDEHAATLAGLPFRWAADWRAEAPAPSEVGTVSTTPKNVANASPTRPPPPPRGMPARRISPNPGQGYRR